MTKDECWQKFSQTGCVADYLAYVNSKESEMQQTNSREDYSNTYAGFDKCDGDDFEIGTYR